MGNTLNVTSCVECMDDSTATAFPRPDGASEGVSNGGSGGMCDSTNMQALSNHSTTHSLTHNQIPITTETINDIIEISVMKPLGVTLCDSAMVSGVYVTAIKPEGHIARVSVCVSVGMMLVELNSVDVTTYSLERVIKMISDSPVEKRLILKFRGTAPATHSATTTLDTTPDTTPSTVSTTAQSTAQSTDSTADSTTANVKQPETEKQDTAEDKATTTVTPPVTEVPDKDASTSPTDDVAVVKDDNANDTTAESHEETEGEGEGSVVSTPGIDTQTHALTHTLTRILCKNYNF